MAEGQLLPGQAAARLGGQLGAGPASQGSAALSPHGRARDVTPDPGPPFLPQDAPSKAPSS